MKTRQRLRITHVGEFGDGSLADSVSLRSERTTAVGGEAPPAEMLPSEGDIVGGCYRLVRRLGEGMFGSVFEAVRTDVPEHRVALKVIRRAIYAGRNVVRELVMLAATTHPNIVQLKDHGVARDHVWLTMPLYEGETLAERLARGPLGMREAYEIFGPIAHGVQALHDRGLRHQDIKPENVFLARLGDRVHPVLLDLGVAVERHATFVAGTALYGAPEQIAALSGMPALELSEKMDSYGLASTLLAGLVGREHFPGEGARTPYELAEAFAVREERPLHPDALPEVTGAPRRALERALARWLERDPAARPTMAALAGELDVLLEPEREAARAIEVTLERQRRAHRRTRLALVGLVLGASAAGLVAYGQRETLRLAGELRRAEAEGAASFDKLDTCAAAHRLSEERASACEAAGREAEAAHALAMEELHATSAAAEGAFARRLATVSGRLDTCRDEAAEASAAFATERRGLEDERQAAERRLREREAIFRDERAALIAERDALTGERRDLRAARDQLLEERDQLLGERDALLAAKARAEADRTSCSEARVSLEAEARRCDHALASCRDSAGSEAPRVPAGSSPAPPEEASQPTEAALPTPAD